MTDICCRYHVPEARQNGHLYVHRDAESNEARLHPATETQYHKSELKLPGEAESAAEQLGSGELRLLSPSPQETGELRNDPLSSVSYRVRPGIITGVSSGWPDQTVQNIPEQQPGDATKPMRKAWEKILSLRDRYREMRVQVAEKRSELRRARSAARDADADFMKALHEAWIKGIFSRSTHLEKLYDVCCKARDTLGPLEESYDELEYKLDKTDYELSGLEAQYKDSINEDIGPPTSGHGLGGLGDSMSPSEGWSGLGNDSGPVYAPLLAEYYSKAGDLNIVRESLSSLEFEHMQFLEGEEVRKRHGLTLSEESVEFLANFGPRRAELQNELRELELNVGELRQKCVEEGLIDQGHQLLTDYIRLLDQSSPPSAYQPDQEQLTEVMHESPETTTVFGNSPILQDQNSEKPIVHEDPEITSISNDGVVVRGQVSRAFHGPPESMAITDTDLVNHDERLKIPIDQLPGYPGYFADPPSSRFPLLMERSRRYGGGLIDANLVSQFADTRDRINRWLLDILSSSAVEIVHYRSFLEDTSTDARRWDEMWPDLVVEFWSKDDAATGPRLSLHASLNHSPGSAVLVHRSEFSEVDSKSDRGSIQHGLGDAYELPPLPLLPEDSRGAQRGVADVTLGSLVSQAGQFPTMDLPEPFSGMPTPCYTVSSQSSNCQGTEHWLSWRTSRSCLF